MTETKTLFHKSDPETSRTAAEKMVKSGELSRQEQEVYRAIIRAMNNMSSCLEKRHQNFTAKELASWSGLDYFMIQRRLSGLKAKGKVERIQTGTTVKGKPIYLKRDGQCCWRAI